MNIVFSLLLLPISCCPRVQPAGLSPDSLFWRAKAWTTSETWRPVHRAVNTSCMRLEGVLCQASSIYLLWQQWSHPQTHSRSPWTSTIHKLSCTFSLMYAEPNAKFVLTCWCGCRWVKDLIDPNARETALLELSKQREKFPELAPYLWNSFGTMAVLLQVQSSSKGDQPSPWCPCHKLHLFCRRSH